jgi:hypothetical protein
MIKWISPLILLNLQPGTTYAASTHLDNFKIHQCREDVCLSAEGPKAFVSHGGDIRAASNIDMEIKTGVKNSEHYHCASFRYELKSQFLACDNREAKGPSLTLDSNLRLKRY